MTVLTETFSAAPALRARIVGLRAKLVEALEKRSVYRTTVRELEYLTDRELADLGLSRSTIRAVAYEAAYGK